MKRKTYLKGRICTVCKKPVADHQQAIGNDHNIHNRCAMQHRRIQALPDKEQA